MNTIDQLLIPSLRPSHKYYWRNLISRHHISRMLKLAPIEKLTGDVNGVADRRYLMYRVETLTSSDATFHYEFLIEYDIYNPSQGIYLGCKAVSPNGQRHSHTISLASEDWLRVNPHVLLRLNNTFIDKDFTNRFQDPDNADNNTFWPFWITLYEDEDPKEQAIKILSIIVNTYRQLLEGNLPQLPPKITHEKKKIDVRTAFTEEAYCHLQDSIISSVKIKTVPLSPDSNVLTTPQEAWVLFEEFLMKAEKQNILHRVEYYEKAWIIDSNYSDIDFKCLITLLFNRISERLNIDSFRIPWSSLIAIFLRSDGTTFKQQIKTLNPTPSTCRYWKNIFETMYSPEY